MINLKQFKNIVYESKFVETQYFTLSLITIGLDSIYLVGIWYFTVWLKPHLYTHNKHLYSCIEMIVENRGGES